MRLTTHLQSQLIQDITSENLPCGALFLIILMLLTRYRYPVSILKAISSCLDFYRKRKEE